MIALQNIDEIDIELVDYPPHLPDLAPLDYLFPVLKHLRSKRFSKYCGVL